MANRSTLDGVVRYGEPNPNKSQFENNQAQFILGGGGSQSAKPVDNMSATELRNENERLRYVISTWKQNKPVIKQQVLAEGGIPEQFNKRIAYNE